MAAYSALVSLEQHLKQLLVSDQFPLPDHKSQLHSFHQTISSLRSSVQTFFPTPKSDRETASILQNQIRDAIYEAQDAIESFIFAKSASLSFAEIAQKIDPITAQAKDLADSIRRVNASWIDGDIPPPPRSGIISGTFRIVGQEKDKQLLIDELIDEEDKLRILPISGMAGIGKTTLARSIYEDTKIKNSFPYRAWVTVSQNYHVGDILARLLNSMESRGQKAGERVYEGSDDKLEVHMHQSLYNNKYLIVIDDIWDRDNLYKVFYTLPDNKNGSRIILTTRILSVAKSVKSSDFCHEMQPLDEENSWILLCDKAFEGKPCPPHLEKIGREITKSIAKKCEGLPLSITVIGGLMQERMNVESWMTIEEDMAFANVSQGDESYMDFLSLSYTYLPAEHKACFLYMGAFPKDSEIRVSKLIKLWAAEGFLPSPSPRDQTLEAVAESLLVDLYHRNLILVHEVSSNGRIKICGVHDSIRELAEKECGIEKFFHSRKKYSQILKEDSIIQRRVSIHTNLLMSIEEVYESTKLISSARTLLYLGPHHHHPLPFCLTFDLLRVLDAFTVYFIRFPLEFLELVHLKYLSLTYNHEIPSRICHLRQLQTLMVRREPKLIFVGASFLPDEIWQMPQLRHLWFTESDFPTLPPSPREMVLLVNLQTLTNVNAAFFTDEVLDNMPNLKKLVMWIEAPDKLNFNVSKLHQLEHFRFVVLNPVPGKGIEVEAENFFPKTLKRLTLSGCGLPWEYMKYVGENLQDLEVLKLKELAFVGGEWCVDYQLEKLKYLLIEYLNFRKWEVECNNFPSLQRLILRHCYELEEIPEDLGFIVNLELIELVECSPSAVASANYIMEEQVEYDKINFHVRIFSSWE